MLGSTTAVSTLLTTREDVARLFARVAFGASAAELDQWTGRPYVDMVDSLLAVPPPGPLRTQPDDATRNALYAWGGVVDENATPKLDMIQTWWLERMRTTPWPLLERLTLFWHGHWATAYGPFPDAGMMLVQNQLLRDHALGSFRAMANAMNVDSAMLWWLSGQDNRTPHPNENYAREFFELFTLGKDPQVYTEQDVREAARAFTGWGTNIYARTVQFDPTLHDNGVKRILGRTVPNLGAAEHEAITDIALAHPVAPRFLARKLVCAFAYVASGDDPLVAKVADTLRSTDFDLQAAVRTMLLADEFRHPDHAAGRQHVRPPVDVLVSAAKAIGIPLTGSAMPVVIRLLGRLGQQPFKPPNVGGWPMGLRWLTPATLLARYDLAFTLFYARDTTGPGRVLLPPSNDLDAWTARFGMASLDANTARVIREHVDAQDPSLSEEVRQLGVLALLLTSPDWMVV
ncbi:MAG: hypothetical protein QOI20_1311 [Acidimicrobiaceae bacterium]|nr:hypothetical protein [Acidimicrobiaceae bacterium]